MSSELSKNDEANSVLPSAEDKHFRDAQIKGDIQVNGKNATTNFLNSETDRTYSNTETSTKVQHSINVKPSIKDERATEYSNKPVAESHNGGVTANSEKTTSENASAEAVPKKQVPLTDQNIDDNLPSTVTLLRTPDGGKCYLIGTAHFSIESQNDVSKIIQAVRPHVVVVELCVDRVHVLQLDEETILEESKNLNFSKIMDTIKENGAYKGLFYLLLLHMSARLTKVLGLAPGGEFRRALQESKKLPNCVIHMGDRPIKITFARALNALSWWQTIKLAYQLLTEKEPLTQGDVEKYKSRDSLEEMMAQLAEEYPAIGEIFVKERDIYLTHSLQLACRPKLSVDNKIIPARVVGIVGIGHTCGIAQHWGKVDQSQIPPIMVIPPPSKTSKVLKFTVKASAIGVVVYVGYRLAFSLKSLVQNHIRIPISFEDLKITW